MIGSLDQCDGVMNEFLLVGSPPECYYCWFASSPPKATLRIMIFLVINLRATPEIVAQKGKFYVNEKYSSKIISHCV